MSTTYVRLPGLCGYAEVHALQADLVHHRAADACGDVVLFVEHEPSITVGRSRDAERHIVDAGDVPVVNVERGGDVTWHGPGQLVAYPIVKLQGERADLHLHLRSLEDAVIGLLTDYGLAPTRDPRNTGVWLPEPDGPPRKVCSIGIACRRWVSWHGLALNVRTDGSGFARIEPCGFSPQTMTRLADHLQPAPSVDGLVTPLANHLARTLALEPSPVVRAAAPTLAAVRALL